MKAYCSLANTILLPVGIDYELLDIEDLNILLAGLDELEKSWSHYRIRRLRSELLSIREDLEKIEREVTPPHV